MDEIKVTLFVEVEGAFGFVESSDAKSSDMEGSPKG